jgi:hypothetical protein
MKYIILDDGSIECPVIFSEILKHDAVAGRRTVTGAGFCRFSVKTDGTIGVTCWGKSISLNVKSRGKKDEEIIMKHHNNFSY